MKPVSITNKKQSEQDKRLQQELNKSGEIPQHIAIIMDGNGRWAQKRGNIRLFGHRAGVDSVREITETCAQVGVKYLTLYAFSTENWDRPRKEVNGLMKILVNSLRKEARNLDENNVHLESIGQIDRLPPVCQRELNEAIDMTKDNDGLQLCLALSYSGRWDITEAVKKLAVQVKNGDLDPNEIQNDHISNHLSTAHIPDPDLVIRTSGEYRLSNFLLWQLAYSELFISKVCWPDFKRQELYKAIRAYQSRERRFGKTSEQQSNGADCPNSATSYERAIS
ncbi:MAG: isoprenyl transferase [Bacteroidota bacterium]